MQHLLYIVMNLDSYLEIIVGRFGIYSYLIIFFIIFFETAFVITAFMPVDSILFVSGVIAKATPLNIYILLIGVYISTVLGDISNYYIGRFFGKRIVIKEKTLFIRKEHVDKASMYYESYGMITVIMSRFIPIVKSLIPFSAGIAKMNIWKFILCNIIGASIWILLFLGGGLFIGGYEVVRKNLVYFIIISKLIVLIPGSFILLKEKRDNAPK